jgi:hypothetical protein
MTPVSEQRPQPPEEHPTVFHALHKTPEFLPLSLKALDSNQPNREEPFRVPEVPES